MEEYINAEFIIPQLKNKKIIGSLFLTQDSNYFITNQRINFSDKYRIFDVIYVKTHLKEFTCVRCIPYKTSGTQAYYLIDELYDGGKLKKANIKCLKKVSAKISYLTEWINDSLLKFSQTKETGIFSKIEIKDENRYTFCLIKDIEIKLSFFTKISSSRHQFVLKDDHEIIIESNKPQTRSIFFRYYYSFIIFYSLFVKKIPRTTKLTFVDKFKSEFNLLGLGDKDDQSLFNILLPFHKIENFQEVLTTYFNSLEKYNSVVQLFLESMKENDPEITFLYLTQCLEMFHRDFIEKDSSDLKKISTEVKQVFNFKSSYKKWIQLYRYFHLMKVAKENNFNLEFSKNETTFLQMLKDSRNYYTHHDRKDQIWKYSELRSINNLLRRWCRSLILFNLGIRTQEINSCIRSELISFNQSNIFENEYSMRYRNHFTIH